MKHFDAKRHRRVTDDPSDGEVRCFLGLSLFLSQQMKSRSFHIGNHPSTHFWSWTIYDRSIKMSKQAQKMLLMLLGIVINPVLLQNAAAETAFAFVPAQASGGFGIPGDGVPLIQAATFHRKGTVTIKYVSGTISDSVANGIGPRGGRLDQGTGLQTPLQEAVGTAFGVVKNQWALIGAFVPKSVADSTEFSAVDGSKGTAAVGIPPNSLFFIGNYYTLDVSGPGTLYLGINDPGVADNSGGYTVKIITP
ncbi:MAG TPA: hypothetical protein VLK65_22610 [Vicinamibacteria bacterium]|nr:hypothetical protein [Vicinamibacteria bacterium]